MLASSRRPRFTRATASRSAATRPPWQALQAYLDGGYNEEAVANQVTRGKGGLTVVYPPPHSGVSPSSQWCTPSSQRCTPSSQVTRGKGAMPAFGGRLADADIQEVATYVIASAKEGWK